MAPKEKKILMYEVLEILRDHFEAGERFTVAQAAEALKCSPDVARKRLAAAQKKEHVTQEDSHYYFFTPEQFDKEFSGPECVSLPIDHEHMAWVKQVRLARRERLQRQQWHVAHG